VAVGDRHVGGVAQGPFGLLDPLLALMYWQTPAAITVAGAERIAVLLRRCRIRNATAVSDALVAAAAAQAVTLPGSAPPSAWSSSWPGTSWPSTNASTLSTPRSAG
jgi:hypothetical protein